MTDYFLTAPVRYKRASEVKPFTVDLKRYLRSYWIAGRRYAQSDMVRSPSNSGFAYSAQNAGEAGTNEPPWAYVAGQTFQDGSINWIAVAPGTNAVDTIASAPGWGQLAPPDATLVISAQSNTIEETTAAFGAGTAGNTYRINCAVTTTAGNVYVVQFDLEVS